MINNPKKVCYILAYFAPNYIRTTTLISAIKKIEDVKLYKCKNTKTNFLRYFETLLKLIKIRIKYNPDIYILGFRGHEIFLPVRIITLGKKLIFDEFICSYDYYKYEHNKNTVLSKVIFLIEKTILKFSNLILTDTNLLKERIHDLYKIDKNKIETVYVGSDENVFKPINSKKEKRGNFNVFFYGTILPLHGIETILESARILLGNKNIDFTIIGGKGKPKMIEKIQKTINENNLSNITYKEWVNYDELPNYISNSDICLGGPFGDTMQAKRVITGKAFQFLSMGKPTIIGEVNEDVGFKDKENILLVKIGDAENLAEKILWAYDHKQQLENIGKNGRMLYSDKFSIEIISNRLRKILENVTKK